MTSQLRDLRMALADQVIKSYSIGPGTDGVPLFAYPDGTPLAEAMTGEWTAADLIAGIGFLSALVMSLAFEVDDRQAEGRPVDVTAFLDRQAMALVLLAAQEAGR